MPGKGDTLTVTTKDGLKITITDNRSGVYIDPTDRVHDLSSHGNKKKSSQVKSNAGKNDTKANSPKQKTIQPPKQNTPPPKNVTPQIPTYQVNSLSANDLSQNGINVRYLERYSIGNQGTDNSGFGDFRAAQATESRNRVQETVNPISKAVTSVVDSYNKIAKKSTLLPEIPSVSAIGVGGDLLPFTGSVQLVGDKTGNVGVVINRGFKGKSDIECGGSFVGTVSYNMQSVADLNGSSTFVGGGYDFGEGIGVSADYSYSFSNTSDGRYISTHSVAVGGNVTFVPGEINTGTTKSTTYTINLYDAIYNVYKFFSK